MPQTRQLAAIMFTDIVGYTALMGDNEQKAFEILTKSRALQKPIIEKYNGRWIKELGDGVLASFASVSDAVNAAQEIQEQTGQIQDFSLRIGIHLGEIIFEEGDVFGDAVNICFRLQTLAPVGGIYISGAVQSNISNKKDIYTKFIKAEVLKHVKEPVQIYEVITSKEEARHSGPGQSSKEARSSVKAVSVDRKKPSPLFISTLLIIFLASVVLVYRVYFNDNKKQIESIAILPFVNESGNIEVEYLSDGMTESLISSLSQLPTINVKARSSVFRYKDKETDIQNIGKELNVQAIINGTVVQRGQDLALHIELVDTKTETVLWSADYKQPLANIINLQSEIAVDVSQKLKSKLSGADEQKLAKSYTNNPEAYQLYLRGRFHWNKRTANDFGKAIEYFQQAIALEPNYALAYTGLADAYALTSIYEGASPHEMMPKAKDAAIKALSLDDNLAEAHASLGQILQNYDFDFENAEIEYKRAIALNPNYASAHQWYGELLAYLGKQEESFVELRRALELDPLSLVINRIYGAVMFYARLYDSSIVQLKRTEELDANFPGAHHDLSVVYMLKSDYTKSVEEFARWRELRGGDPQEASLVRISFAKGGWQGFLRAMTGSNRPLDLNPYRAATFYAALGEKDKAISELNTAYEKRDDDLCKLKVDPRLDSLRDDQRFKDLLRRVASGQ